MIRRKDQDDRKVPLEDIAVLVLENPSITLTVACLQRLFEQNVVVVVCNAKHMPEALLLPSSANNVHSEVLRLQIQSSLPMTKQLWRQTVQAKIGNQAELLERLNRKGSPRVRQLVREVKSDDSDNREGVAARIYWQELFDDPTFIREREGNATNSLLNYGYAILRAATAGL